MTLNIISNFAANIALRNLSINGDEATKSVSKLSSGSRVVTAADDAAALAIGTRLNTEVRSLEQASINAGQAVSLLQIGDGGLSRLQEMLTRMKTLAVQAGSDNLSNTERALLDTEYQNLKLEIDRLTKDTKFNGISILGSEVNVSGTEGILGAASGVTAADTIAGTGIAQFGGAWASTVGPMAADTEVAVLSETVGNTRGVLDFSIRGIDNRAITAGGDGAVKVTIFQGDINVATTAVQQTAAPGQTINVTNAVFLDTNGGGYLVYASNAAAQTIATNGTNPNLTTNVTGAGEPAVAGQDLIFTAIFEFGDLDGDGANDYLVKKTTLDGSLLVDDGVASNVNGVSLATGVTIAFGNDLADFSSAGGISKESAKNASVVISLDPASAGTAFNLGFGGSLASDQTFQGLFAANANGVGTHYGYAQGVIGAFSGTIGSSSAVDFDFKVGTGIIPDEDNINIKIGGVTLEQLGISNTNILTKGGADASSENIAFALDYLVNIRSDIGASINRLETASDNIAISMENQEAARSRLLDLNVAAEITTFTSKQILLQSGISTLAQANQLPQNLLRLFA